MSTASADRARPDRTAADFGTPSPVATQRPSIAGVAAVAETVVHRGGMFDGQQETTVRWQPVARVDVVVSVRGEIEPADVLAFATGLRFDRASRCAVPLRLGDLPSGARVTGCAFRLSNFAAEPGAGRGRGDLLVSGPNGSTLEVRYLGPQGPEPSTQAKTTLANGWKYSVMSTDSGMPGAPNAVIRVHEPWHLEAQATGGTRWTICCCSRAGSSSPAMRRIRRPGRARRADRRFGGGRCLPRTMTVGNRFRHGLAPLSGSAASPTRLQPALLYSDAGVRRVRECRATPSTY
ncbi:hypothetical protein ACFQZ4_04505 [Catellatospora coxensis]